VGKKKNSGRSWLGARAVDTDTEGDTDTTAEIEAASTETPAAQVAGEQQGDKEVNSKEDQPAVEVDFIVGDSEDELDWLVEGEAQEQTLSQKLVKNVVEPIRETPAVRNVLGLVSLYFFGTFLWSTFKTVKKLTSPKAKRRRKVNANLTVIETLNEYFPNNRDSLTTAALDKIKYVTKFSNHLIFRKYFRYMLNERKFDTEAVADLLTLKAACQLGDDDLKDIFREVASRTFKKYGILMTDTSGLTADAIMKKAVERSIFSKLLYLVELPEMMTQDEQITNNLSWQIQEIFGATSEDAEKLRISSLSELDADDLERLMPTGEQEEEGENGSEESTQQDAEE
jgi:hypothetical protein